MAGIYIHIPFCKSKCSYCDFHFSTLLKYKNNFIPALLNEMKIRKDYLKDEKIETIYFGGGTPSLLSSEEIVMLLETINKFFNTSLLKEITLEANPDDITLKTAKDYKKAGINRLSIGIQSFFNEDLKFLKRIHNAEKARKAISDILKVGFENFSIDLIYAIPDMSLSKWEQNLEIALSFKPPHISAYCLTIEPQTELGYFVRKNIIQELRDEKCNEQFKLTMDILKQNNYSHYEISNFSIPQFISLHNSNYWKGKHYIGFGPSAHSYNGISRQWNISNNYIYIKELSVDPIIHFPHNLFYQEQLSEKDLYNEYILTTLRTKWGVDKNFIKNRFTSEYFNNFIVQIKKWEKDGMIQNTKGKFILNDSGKIWSDRIIKDLFII